MSLIRHILLELGEQKNSVGQIKINIAGTNHSFRFFKTSISKEIHKRTNFQHLI